MAKIDWYKLHMPEGEGVHGCVVGGKKLCLVVWDDKVIVTTRRCPHAGADLAKGWCEGNTIVCPYHRHKFDLLSGKGEKGQGNYIRIYETKYEDGDWYVGLPRPWWSRIY